MTCNDSQACWYKLRTEDQRCYIEFQLARSRFWEPAILQECPLRLPRDAESVHEAVLTGAGPVWMYAHTAARCRQEKLEVGFVVIPRADAEDSIAECHSHLTFTGTDRRGAVLEICMRGHPPVSETAKRKLLDPRLSEIRAVAPPELLVMGRAAVDMYGQVAATAVDAKVNRVFCWSARDGLVCVWNREHPSEIGGPWPLPDWYRSVMQQPALPLVIGVVGDPRHGKSVFSRCLEFHGTKTSQNVWCLDCDAQSPTPPWYISLLSTSREEADQLRNRLRRSWNEEMEQRVARHVAEARKVFDVLVADLPGGDHRNPQRPNRIPDTRRQLFEEIDAFIVLDDEQGKSGSGWQKALQEVNLADRICAVVTSVHPDAELTFEIQQQPHANELLQGTLSGLRRDRVEQLPRLYEQVRPALDRLWTHACRWAQRVAISRK